MGKGMSDTQQPIGTYDAFGDESVGPDYAVYGTILIDRSRRVEADEIIAQAKITSGAEPSDVLHSRSMFSGQQRQKTPWSQKTMTEVFEICSDLLLRLDDLLVRKIVAVAKKADLPAVIPGGQWKASDPDYIGPLPWADGWAVGDKNIATWCAHGTMFPLSKWPGFNNIQFWPDPDHSLIATEGGRRKFSTQLSSFAVTMRGRPQAR